MGFGPLLITLGTGVLPVPESRDQGPPSPENLPTCSAVYSLLPAPLLPLPCPRLAGSQISALDLQVTPSVSITCQGSPRPGTVSSPSLCVLRPVSSAAQEGMISWLNCGLRHLSDQGHLP